MGNELAIEVESGFPSNPRITADLYKEQRGAGLDSIDVVDDNEKTVYGRIKSVRSAGKKLLFLDCWRDGEKLQIVCNSKEMDEFALIKAQIGVGDICEFHGKLGVTPAGQPSLFAKVGKILSPCLRPIPAELNNDDTILRSPTLNFLVNTQSIDRLKMRSNLISNLRSLLKTKGFLEVETPILSSLAGGANARPFETKLNALDDLPLEMRIAPELFLKQLIIGGFEKVFEIGKQFRNEGMDATHNPEFTTCELYQTYTTLENMMQFTESLLADLIVDIAKGPITIHLPDGSSTEVLDLKTPFQRLEVVKELELYCGQKLPDFSTTSALANLLEMCHAKRIPLGKGPHTIPRVLDKMIGHIIEPRCIQPTFLVGHPTIMSPLSKCLKSDPSVSDRFELFIGGKEYVNAYAELNNPYEQRARFLLQQADRTGGDVEAQVLDEDFCNALEYGMPPTVGWGLGIDRLCMLVSNSRHIRDVIAFPLSKPK